MAAATLWRRAGCMPSAGPVSVAPLARRLMCVPPRPGRRNAGHASRHLLAPLRPAAMAFSTTAALGQAAHSGAGQAHAASHKPRTHYDVLGVARSASARDIKSSYYKLAMLHHPDRHGGSAEAHASFEHISNAYRVLGDAQLRRDYDLELDRAVEAAQVGQNHFHAGAGRHRAASAYDAPGMAYRSPRRASASAQTLRYNSKEHYDEHYGRGATGRMRRQAEEEREHYRQHADHWGAIKLLLLMCGVFFLAQQLKRKLAPAPSPLQQHQQHQQQRDKQRP